MLEFCPLHMASKWRFQSPKAALFPLKCAPLMQMRQRYKKLRNGREEEQQPGYCAYSACDVWPPWTLSAHRSHP